MMVHIQWFGGTDHPWQTSHPIWAISTCPQLAANDLFRWVAGSLNTGQQQSLLCMTALLRSTRLNIL